MCICLDDVCVYECIWKKYKGIFILLLFLFFLHIWMICLTLCKTGYKLIIKHHLLFHNWFLTSGFFRRIFRWSCVDLTSTPFPQVLRVSRPETLSSNKTTTSIIKFRHYSYGETHWLLLRWTGKTGQTSQNEDTSVNALLNVSCGLDSVWNIILCPQKTLL